MINNKILLSILLLSLFLRISTVLWGYPISPYVKQYHPDEPKAYSMTYKFPNVYFSDDRFLTYGTSISYTLGTIMLPIKFVVVKLLGFDQLYKGFVWIISRFFSVVCGVGTVYLGYLLALKLFNKNTALIAATLIATSFYHTMNSSVATLDVPMSCILVANFLLCFRAMENPSKSNFVVLGIASGLLMGTKIPGGLFIVIPFILIFLSKLSSIETNIRYQIKLDKIVYLLMVYIFSVIAIFAIYHPHIFLDPKKYIDAYVSSKYNWVDRHSVSSFYQYFQIWITATSKAVSYPVTILAIIGVFLLKRKYWHYKIMLLLFVVLYYALWRSFLPSRFIITIVPILCIFAANACACFIESKTRILKFLGIVSIATTVIYSLYLCTSGIILRFNDTRTLASRYIAETFSKGTSIGLSSVTDTFPNILHGWRYPKIDFEKYQHTNFLNKPEIFVASSYDFEKVNRALESEKLLPGYRWDPKWNKDWYRYIVPSPNIFKFYDKLLNTNESNYVLLKSFEKHINVQIEFPPPEIRIYKKSL